MSSPKPRKRPGIRVNPYDVVPGVREFSNLAMAIEAMNLIVLIAAASRWEMRRTLIGVWNRGMCSANRARYIGEPNHEVDRAFEAEPERRLRWDTQGAASRKDLCSRPGASARERADSGTLSPAGE